MRELIDHAILNGYAKLLEVGICLVLAIPVAIVWALLRARKMDKDNNSPI